MKNILLAFAAAVFCCFACGKTSKSTTESKPAINADSLGMADALHQFFKWYGETGEQLITKIDFVNTAGEHPILDLTLLAKYLAEFSKSGAVCNEFSQNETIYYRACALVWPDERSDEMFTGFDIDRYYCQQDGDVREFLTAGVSSKINGDRAEVQLMLDPKGANGGPRDFEMKKENGKWLLSKIGCQSASIHETKH